MSSVLKGLTKREALAFKVGGWASLPIDFVIENYGIPFAKKHFGEKAFYAHIKKMGLRRRRGKYRRRKRKILGYPKRYGLVSYRTGRYGRRRLTTPMEIEGGLKRKVTLPMESSLSRAVKKGKEMSVVVGRTEKKTHFEKLVFAGTDPFERVDVGTLFEMQLFNVGQGAAMGS